MGKTSAHGLTTFINNKTNPIGLEIGVYNGTNAEYLLDSTPNLILYGVDPYYIYTDWNGRLTHHGEDPHKAQETADKLLQRFGSRYIKIKKTSDDALTMFEDNFFDFIFIDGLHTYEQVLLDCKNYYPKLKQNCVFSGHDYNTIAGVRQAVDEFVNSINKSIVVTEHDAWFFIK